MTNRKAAFKRALVLLGMGGMTFQFFLGGWNAASCISNDALTAFYSAVGDASIETFTAPAAAVGTDFDNIIVGPTTGFLQSIWNGYVFTQIPQDPDLTLLTQ